MNLRHAVSVVDFEQNIQFFSLDEKIWSQMQSLMI